jgi:hypothetical protein
MKGKRVEAAVIAIFAFFALLWWAMVIGLGGIGAPPY